MGAGIGWSGGFQEISTFLTSPKVLGLGFSFHTRLDVSDRRQEVSLGASLGRTCEVLVSRFHTLIRVGGVLFPMLLLLLLLLFLLRPDVAPGAEEKATGGRDSRRQTARGPCVAPPVPMDERHEHAHPPQFHSRLGLTIQKLRQSGSHIPETLLRELDDLQGEAAGMQLGQPNLQTLSFDKTNVNLCLFQQFSLVHDWWVPVAALAAVRNICLCRMGTCRSLSCE